MQINVLIFWKDDTQSTVSFHGKEDNREYDLRNKLKVMGKSHAGIKSYFFMSEKEIGRGPYKLDSFDRLIIDRQSIISERLEHIREVRSEMLASLDLPYKIASETGNKRELEYIKLKNQFLRDIPQRINWDMIPTNRLWDFDPFNNLFKIEVLHGGEGYVEAPNILINPPKGFGFPAKARAIVANGVITEVLIEDFGCGYTEAPVIIAQSPNAINPAILRAVIENTV